LHGGALDVRTCAGFTVSGRVEDVFSREWVVSSVFLRDGGVTVRFLSGWGLVCGYRIGCECVSLICGGVDAVIGSRRSCLWSGYGIGWL